MNIKKKLKIRSIIQIIFFVIIGVIAIGNFASLHALCPFGGVVTSYNLLTEGTFVQKIHSSSVILMIIIFVLTIFFGSVFCGFVCPFGSIQEWIGKLGKKIFPNKYNKIIPAKTSRVLSYFRFFVLVWVILITAKTGTLLFSNIDPYHALFQFWTDEVTLQAIIILVVVLLLSLVIKRPWCKYFCPYGALLGIFNKIRVFKIKRNPETCVNCKKCDRSCPMDIEVSKSENVNNFQCISCYECTSQRSCPIENTVNVKLKISIIAVIIIVLIFGGIAATMYLDIWSTENRKKPVRFESGDSIGEYNPADIRGSYTFNEISRIYDIEASILFAAFDFPENSNGNEIKSKDIEKNFENTEYEIGNKSMQVFVALYKGLPITLEEDIFLPEKAVNLIIINNKDLTDLEKTWLDSHKVNYSN